jgi:hypothetical protein
VLGNSGKYFFKIQRTIASSASGGNKVKGIKKKAASALIKKADERCKAVY